MTANLQHDPMTKQQIKDALYEFLYTPLLKQFQSRLDTIIAKNSVLLGNAERSLTYKGVVYQSNGASLPRNMNRLHKQMQPSMDDYVNDLKQLNSYEIPYVLGFISQVLNSSNNPQDYLLVLPPSVHPPVEQLIKTCPCRTKKLSLIDIQNLQIRNQLSINLMKQRQVLNLLI